MVSVFAGQVKLNSGSGSGDPGEIQVPSWSSGCQLLPPSVLYSTGTVKSSPYSAMKGARPSGAKRTVSTWSVVKISDWKVVPSSA